MNGPRTRLSRSWMRPKPTTVLEVVGSVVLVGLSLFWLEPIVGKAARLLILVGIGYWGIRRGMVGGIVASMVYTLGMVPLLAGLGLLVPEPVAALPFVVAAFTALGAVIGRMRDLGRRLRAELAARKEAEALLSEEQEGFRIFFEGNPHPMWIFDEETLQFLKVNQAKVDLYGYSMEEFGRMTLLDVQLSEHLPTLLEFRNELARNQGGVRIFERRHRKQDGSVIEVEIVSQSFKYRGRPARLGQVTDVTERNRKRAALEFQALHDQLTGLPNRASFRDQLDRAMEQARLSGGRVSVFLMDLDRFKAVNDILGHAYGDLVLQQVAARLLDVLRQGDILARLGGDEFGLLLVGGEVASARRVGERMLSAFEEPFVFEGRDFDVGTSIGIACHPDHDHGDGDPATLLNLADLAMYAAKRERVGLAVYDPSLHDGGANPPGPDLEGPAMILPYRNPLDPEPGPGLDKLESSAGT